MMITLSLASILICIAIDDKIKRNYFDILVVGEFHDQKGWNVPATKVITEILEENKQKMIYFEEYPSVGWLQGVNRGNASTWREHICRLEAVTIDIYILLLSYLENPEGLNSNKLVHVLLYFKYYNGQTINYASTEFQNDFRKVLELPDNEQREAASKFFHRHESEIFHHILKVKNEVEKKFFRQNTDIENEHKKDDTLSEIRNVSWSRRIGKTLRDIPFQNRKSIKVVLKVGADHLSGLQTTLPNALDELLGMRSYSLDFQEIYHHCHAKANCDEKKIQDILNEKFGKVGNGMCDPATLSGKPPRKCAPGSWKNIPSTAAVVKILSFVEEIQKQDPMSNFCVDRKVKPKKRYNRSRFTL